MIKNWLITGDTHGNINRFKLLAQSDYKPEETAIIVLGDMSINFFLDKSDTRRKRQLQELGFTYYLVRGNHEMRPTRLPNIKIGHDNDVHDAVYFEPEYPNIKYLIDGHYYMIKDKIYLVIGGAYSVDKYYRLGNLSDEAPYYECAARGWFQDEQLTEEEMQEIKFHTGKNQVDVILTHTCPISWEPTDLFLSGIDQSTVDKSMEVFLEWIKEHSKWKYWFFGHFHKDRAERPHVEQFYMDITNLDEIFEDWEKYDKTGELPLIDCSPNFDK